MNIFRTFLIRNYYIKEGISNNFDTPDEYDDWLNGEIEKYSQIDFIIGLEKEIILNILDKNNKNFSIELQKASAYKAIIFDIYVLAYIEGKGYIESIEVKDKLKEIFDFIEKYYEDSNTLALLGLRDYRKEHGI